MFLFVDRIGEKDIAYHRKYQRISFNCHLFQVPHLPGSIIWESTGHSGSPGKGFCGCPGCFLSPRDGTLGLKHAGHPTHLGHSQVLETGSSIRATAGTLSPKVQSARGVQMAGSCSSHPPAKWPPRAESRKGHLPLHRSVGRQECAQQW